MISNMAKFSGVSSTDQRYIETALKQTAALPGIETIENLRPEQIGTLSGGVDAATYLVRSREGQVVIKINDHDIGAEAEALQAWRDRHARVPQVLGYGYLRSGASTRRGKYLVQKAILTPHGRLVETCANYLVAYPEKAREIGRLLGIELTKMHRAIAPRSFGEYGDAAGNTAAYQSWNAYMQGYLKLHRDYLRKLGISEDELAQVEQYIDDCKFAARGRYLHGDFSIRNAAIKSYEPLKVSVFDPNPIVGDPTWDIAVLFNNEEYRRRRQQHTDDREELYNRDKQLLIGFKQGYQRKIRQDNLLVSQLMQAILQTQYTAGKVAQKQLDKLELRVREDFIKDIVEAMAGGRHARD